MPRQRHIQSIKTPCLYFAYQNSYCTCKHTNSLFFSRMVKLRTITGFHRTHGHRPCSKCATRWQLPTQNWQLMRKLSGQQAQPHCIQCHLTEHRSTRARDVTWLRLCPVDLCSEQLLSGVFLLLHARILLMACSWNKQVS